MEVTWLGHACFRLRSDNLVVLTDPFPAEVGLRPDSRPATVVTVSNSHPNHSNWQEVAGEPRIVSMPGEYQASGVSIRGIMTPLAAGTPQTQRNVAYVITIDGVNICHLGDINMPLTTRQVDELVPVDVLLLPVGGGCTLDMDRLFEVMQNLDPKLVIPMHYNTPSVKVQLQGLEPFLRRMGTDEAQQPQPRLSVTANTVPSDMKVVVLAPQARASAG
ncbi:MAG: MBL fold metallo-hydrolase [SAR202 cluster bacterium]|nr:MBL fold metallo-hydrolase [SAR202 cluster bacterium]